MAVGDLYLSSVITPLNLETLIFLFFITIFVFVWDCKTSVLLLLI